MNSSSFLRIERDGKDGSRHYVVHTHDPKFSMELAPDGAAPDKIGRGVIKRICVPNSWAGDYTQYAKLRTTAQTNLIIPLPIASDGKSTRLEAFWDVGNVFAEPHDSDTSELRQSAGVAFSWFTPFLGLLDLSYAVPLNPKPGDSQDRFQISFCSGF